MPKKTATNPIPRDCPELIVDAAGRVCSRSPAAARLLARRRRTANLLSGTENARASLLLRPVSGERTLLWVTPLSGGYRRVLFLRRLAQGESLPETFPDPEEGERLTDRIGHFLKMLCGREAVKVRTCKRHGREATVFTFPDKAGIGGELYALADEMIRWGETGCDLRLFRRKGVCSLELLAPDPDELPAPFFQGGKRREKNEKGRR